MVGQVVIGRADDVDVPVLDLKASRCHARLYLQSGQFEIEDLGSANGTYVREVRIEAGRRVPIIAGESVAVGDLVLMVRPMATTAAPGPSPMAHVLGLAERAAAGTINVLLLGETGVGKDVMARLIHNKSPRNTGPFVVVHGAALADPLVESELFGHEKGAFTGALSTKPGLFESAEGGTVFLDEVGELSPSLQAKLLRVIEQKEVTRIGALRPRPMDVRFVAATNRDLEAEVVAGRFRKDLFFRLSGVCLTIPPLRQRRSEINGFIDRFLGEACRALGRTTVPILDDDARMALRDHDFPGNIRELRQCIERACLLGEPGGPLLRADLHLLPPPVRPDDERGRIIEALKSCGGHQGRTARALGMSRKVLMCRLDEYGLPRPRKGQPS